MASSPSSPSTPSKGAPIHRLSKRERQIMETLFRIGEGTVAEIVEELRDAPSYNSVRVTLTILEDKEQVTHRRDGRRYVYWPVATAEETRGRALRHLVRTFFGGSTPSVVSTLLGEEAERLTDDDLGRLAQLIDDERRRRG